MPEDKNLFTFEKVKNCKFHKLTLDCKKTYEYFKDYVQVTFKYRHNCLPET